jgi:hypothetical protein
VEYQRDSKETAQFLLGPELRKVTTLAAGRVLAKARANLAAHVDTGETMRSGRLVHSTRGGVKKDRVSVSVVFGGNAVPLQFGNRRVRATRFLTRALEGD